MYISELTETHRLVFNKFSVCDNHVIVITKEFEKQTDPVTFDDFHASLMVMRSLNAFVFYNSGYNSGASIMHKHLQLIPYESLADGILPVEEAVKSEIKEGLFDIPFYQGMKYKAYGFREGIMD